MSFSDDLDAEIFGDSGVLQDGDLEGFQMDDEFGDADDAAAQWLASQDDTKDVTGQKTDATMGSELEGRMTNADLQLGRISHMEPRIQKGIKDALTGNLNAGKAGYNRQDVDTAAASFQNVTGMKPSDFAEKIKVPEGVEAPRARQDLATVMSMIGETAGQYLDKGPGQNLPSNFQSVETRNKADDDLQQAIGYIDELADLYIHDSTKGSSIYGIRKKAVTESLTKRFMDGVFYEGQESLLPLPNETGVTGLRPTRSYGTAKIDGQFVGGKLGTPHDRKSFESAELDGKIPEDAFWALKPSLKNSLFPRDDLKGADDATRKNAKKQQQFLTDQALEKAEFARKTLRKEMPSMRDESAGQIRMTGFDRPYDEQEDRMNLVNEANILDLEWTPFAGNAPDDTSSEMSLFMEKAQEPGKFADVIEQGSKEWLAQREGKITASQAGELLGKMGADKTASKLASERLGYGEKFLGNAHTREGNEGEDVAKRAFMSGPGQDLNFKTAYFEEGSGVTEGFGVSPDGRLYTDENKSAGLLELKYLSTGSMEGALKKYTPQMQMQMAVTGESNTHFYALDKYTGEYVYKNVQADPDIQKQLIMSGREAIQKAEGLDLVGIKELNKTIKEGKVRKPIPSVAEAAAKKLGITREEALMPEYEEEVDKPMTAYEPHDGRSQMTQAETITPMEAVQERKTLVQQALDYHLDKAANKSDEEKDTAQMQAKANFVQGNDRSGIMGYDSDKTMSEYYKALEKSSKGYVDADAMTAQERAKANFKNNNARPDAFGPDSDTRNADMYKDLEDQSKNAAKRLGELSESFTKAAGIMGEVGNALVAGNKSGMDEVRFAAESGMDVENVRGMRDVMTKAGMSDANVNAVLGQAGQLASTFNDQKGAATEFSRLMQARGTSNNEVVRNLDIPDLQRMKEMNPQQLTGMVANMMYGQDAETKKAIGEMFNMSAMAVSDVDGGVIETAVDTRIDREGLIDTNRGIQSVSQEVRDAQEFGGSMGELVGAGAGAAGTLATIAASKSAKGIWDRMKSPKSVPKAGATPAGKAMASFNKVKSSKAASLLSKYGKANPVTAAAVIGTSLVREVGGIEDDGSLADSGMDILEMAAWGAAAGSVIPGVGTAVGAGVGAAAGIATEAWQWFTRDDGEHGEGEFYKKNPDMSPSKNIGNVAMVGDQSGTAPLQNNVEVNVEVSPDLVRTTANVNGDISTDEETGL